jgi:hypothetical protein
MCLLPNPNSSGLPRSFIGNVDYLTSFGKLQGAQKLGYQQQQILNSVALTVQHDNRNRIFLQRLLEREIAIDRDENVEAFLHHFGKQHSIAQTCPTHLRHRLHVMAADGLRQAPVDTFVKQQFETRQDTVPWFLRERQSLALC